MNQIKEKDRTSKFKETTDISVIIPVYNVERFIAQALDSVFTQTRRPSEIIVVDDGSVDATENEIRSYRYTDKRAQGYSQRIMKLGISETLPIPASDPIDLIYRRQTNGGPAAARNAGIKCARGELIAFLDGDDLWLPRCLQTLSKCLAREEDAVLAFADGLNFNESSGVINTAFSQQGDVKTGRIDNPFHHFILCNRILTGAVLVHRDYLEAAGGFNEKLRYGEDQELWLRLALMGPFVCDSSVVMLRRRHRQSLSRDGDAVFYENGIRSLESLWSRFSEDISNSGVDMARIVRLARRRLAYWYCTQGKYSCALRALWRCWARKPQIGPIADQKSLL